MSWMARALLNVASLLIVMGGLYDLAARKLPGNLATLCSDTGSARVARELLRALGGALVAIGLATAVLANAPMRFDLHARLLLILLLVLPSEGANALGMSRVGSPYGVPLVFIVLAVAGVVLAW